MVTMAAMHDLKLPAEGRSTSMAAPVRSSDRPSGARIVVTLIGALKKYGLKRGVALAVHWRRRSHGLAMANARSVAAARFTPICLSVFDGAEPDRGADRAQSACACCSPPPIRFLIAGLWWNGLRRPPRAAFRVRPTGRGGPSSAGSPSPASSSTRCASSTARTFPPVAALVVALNPCFVDALAAVVRRPGTDDADEVRRVAIALAGCLTVIGNGIRWHCCMARSSSANGDRRLRAGWTRHVGRPPRRRRYRHGCELAAHRSARRAAHIAALVGRHRRTGAGRAVLPARSIPAVPKNRARCCQKLIRRRRALIGLTRASVSLNRLWFRRGLWRQRSASGWRWPSSRGGALVIAGVWLTTRTPGRKPDPHARTGNDPAHGARLQQERLYRAQAGEWGSQVTVPG